MVRRGILLLTLALAPLPSPAAPAAPSAAAAVVQRTYIHGVPYESARSLGAEAVPGLVAQLGDPELEEFRMNIVATLGYIGDPAAVGPLMDFVRDLDGEISVYTFRAALAAFQALGHLAQAGDARAIAFLIDGSDEAHWRSAGLTFSYRDYHGDRLGEVLGRMSVQGLGISGRPEAYRALRELASGDLREDWYDNVGEAMELNGRVAVEGARAVFSEAGR